MTTVVIGVGNEFRSDDAVGIHFARQIQALNFPSIKVVESFGEGSELMTLWEGATRLFVCDAVASNNIPGTIHILEPQQAVIPSHFFNYSTHAFSLAEAIEMSRALGNLPPQVTIYGIEGEAFTAGLALSKVVQASLEKVVGLVKEILSKDLEHA
jgi:hydrogenase maturation protease